MNGYRLTPEAVAAALEVTALEVAKGSAGFTTQSEADEAFTSAYDAALVVLREHGEKG